MLTVTCPECGHSHRVSEDVAGRSVPCPECGSRVPVPTRVPGRRSRLVTFGQVCGTLLCIVAGLSLVGSLARHREQPAAQPVDPGEVRAGAKEVRPRAQAAELCHEYKADERAADARYKGKQILVAGRVQRVERDIRDKAFVMLAGLPEAAVSGVQCFFEKDREGPLAELAPGRLVEIVGKCDGSYGYVMLVECRVATKEDR